MYTLSQRPNKLVARTRLTQNYDQIESMRKIKNAINGHTIPTTNGDNVNGNANGYSNANGTPIKALDISQPKPIFQQYRRPSSHRNGGSGGGGGGNGSLQTVRISGFNDDDAQLKPSPEYEEMIRFIRDSWNVLSTDGDDDTDEVVNGSGNGDTIDVSSASGEQHGSANGVNHSTTSSNRRRRQVIVYHNEPASPELENFGAFDLESWWGRRLFNNITKSA